MKWTFYVLIAYVICTPEVIAQRNSELRQKKENLEYYNKVYKDYESEFQSTEAPREWKDEPFVVLCQKLHLSFLRDDEYNLTKGIFRRRLIIQDESELETFSTFYIQSSQVFGIKHIKPDGTVVEVNVDDAIKVESNVPEVYQDAYHSDEYFKVAIPNLEVGDIIDYFKVYTQYYGGLIQLVTAISYPFPVVDNELIFDVDKLWTFYGNTFNSNTNLKEDVSGGIDANGRKRKSVKRYYLKQENLPPHDIPRFSYTFKYLPTIKFMGMTSTNKFYDKKQEFHTQLKIEDAMRKILNVDAQYKKSIQTTFRPLVKRANLRKKSDEEKIAVFYRILRVYSMEQLNLSGEDMHKAYNAGAVEEVSRQYSSLASNIFAVLFSDRLNKWDITNYFVAVMPEYLGTPNQLITASEIIYGVYVPLTDTYYWSVDNFRFAGEEKSNALGARGYRVLSERFKARNAEYEEIIIPYSDPSKNVLTAKMMVDVKEDNSLNVTQTLSCSGLYKESYASLFLYHTPHIEVDLAKFGKEKRTQDIDNFLDKGFDRSYLKNWRKEDITKFNERDEEYVEIRRNGLKNWLSSDLDLDTLLDHRLIDYGVTKEYPTLTIEFDFKVKDMVNKAGPNLIMDIGKLIGGQYQLEDDEMESRQEDIYMNYAKEIKNEISVNLPEGYIASGLDKLNIHVDNVNCSFISTASQESNVIKIETSKVYKKSMSPASDWDNYIEMLESAYDFTQQKIILKKQK